MLARFLYSAAAIATAVPAIWMLRWTVWGANAGRVYYGVLIASLVLGWAALLSIWHRKMAAVVALAASVLLWVFYAPLIFGLGSLQLNEQKLSLWIFMWQPAGSALEIRNMPNTLGLSPDELQQIKAAGITGELSYFGCREYGHGRPSSAILILQHPVTSLTALRQPKSTTLVYVQNAGNWLAAPLHAPTLDRNIWITPISDRASLVDVELGGGGRDGFELAWPYAR
jgi:hypothetical protein